MEDKVRKHSRRPVASIRLIHLGHTRQFLLLAITISVFLKQEKSTKHDRIQNVPT